MALVAGDFDTAHRMLVPALRDDFPPEELQANYTGMFEYAGGPAAAAEMRVDVLRTLEAWPGKEESDVGWAYVGVSTANRTHGGVCNEAITVIVAEQEGHMAIREMIWGRP